MLRDSKIEIIPAILANNITEVREKIKSVETSVEWVHLDVMDGVFVPNATWNNPADLMHMRLSTKVEMHLMVADPASVYLDWILAGASRIMWHFEATQDHSAIAADIHRRGVEAGIAVNPETPIATLEPFLFLVDRVIIMANTPGASGQAFKEETLEKIKALRELWPDGTIGVDIGVMPETASSAARAGANALISGSYIFSSGDPLNALENLRAALF